jgi:hypothetical protein
VVGASDHMKLAKPTGFRPKGCEQLNAYGGYLNDISRIN